MGIFSGNKNKDELILALDVASSSVGAALFYSSVGNVPQIIFSVREHLSIADEVTFDRLLLEASQALEVVADKALKAGLGAPSKIFCVLSSSWYVSQTRVVRLEKNTPFIFTSKFADSLIAREVALFEEEYIKEYSDTEHHFRPIELKNIKTTLNGYETIEPLAQSVKELQMDIFISMSEERVLQAFEKSIKTHFHHREIKFTSFVMTSFVAVRDMYVHQDNFLLMDIGGEVTDITMVKKNVLRESVSYPIGHNAVIRALSKSLGVGPNEAHTLFSLYQEGHAAETVVKKLEVALKDIKVEWLKNFQSTLANLSNDISVPAAIFLAVNAPYEEFFADIIRNEQFNQYTLTNSKFQIIFLNTRSLHGAAIYEESVVRDPFLILDAIYINRFLNKI
ncbi:MAG: hypothetical protein WD991_02360 [Candidatus Paceibacterota bacterium]